MSTNRDFIYLETMMQSLYDEFLQENEKTERKNKSTRRTVPLVIENQTSKNPSEEYFEYDETGRITNYKNSDGSETIAKYDDNKNLIYYKNNNEEHWFSYDNDGNIRSHRKITHDTNNSDDERCSNGLMWTY